MFTRTTITLSRSAFNANVNAINAVTGHEALALVLKSNAYGHGILQMAQLGQAHEGVSWLCTVGIEEALYLRKQGITKPLLVLSFLDGSIDEAIYCDIHLSVSSYEEAVAVAAASERVGKKAYIHIKLDTGMGRMGFLPDQAVGVLHEIAKLTGVELYGIRTHLSDTGHADHSYSRKQLAEFDTVIDEAASIGIQFKCTHAQSSSSLDLKPERDYSFIRVGASAFGLWKSEEQRTLLMQKYPGFDLTPVLEWRAQVIQLKRVPAGSDVGYKRTFKTTRPTKLAIAPIGYWDGYNYCYSNNGYAVINNHRVPVVGIVSMNITAFDVSEMPEIKIGDELILLGNAPFILPHEVAQRGNCITNEVTTLIHPSIERAIVEHHQPLMMRSDKSVEKLLSM